MSRLRVRIGSIAAVVLLFGFYAVANFVPAEQRVESPLLPDDGLRLGLDLQGGIHWVLGVKLGVAVEQELDFLRDNLEGRLGDEGITGIELGQPAQVEGRAAVGARQVDHSSTVRVSATPAGGPLNHAST